MSTTQDTAANPATTTTASETDTVTLSSDTTQAVTVPAGTFNAYLITDVITTVSNGNTSSISTQLYVSPGTGIVKTVAGAVGSQVTTELASTGTGSTPTTTPGLTATVVKTKLPTTASTEDKIKGNVVLTITNSTATTQKGFNTVSLYASPNGSTVDASSALLGTVKRKLTLKAGKSKNINVPVKKVTLPEGTYTILTQTTDPAGTVTTADTGPTLTVAAPSIMLAATVGQVTPASIKAGRGISFVVTLTNTGSSDAKGPATLSVGLSVNGSDLAVPLATQKRSFVVKAGKANALRVHVKVPKGQIAGTYFPYVSITQGTQTVTGVGTTAVVVS